MTGPDHYREAERLIEEAEHPLDDDARAAVLATAQVHATLALAAATAWKPRNASDYGNAVKS